LGERRAAAVARYLEDLGLAPNRLPIVSHGQDRPLCRRHDEACRARNRRVSLTPEEATP
jgi:peptidoglycan-associated lipoprotein